MNINAERLEALVNSSLIEFERRDSIEERHLVGVVGDVEIHLVVTKDQDAKFDIPEDGCPSICFHCLDIVEAG